MRVGLFSGCFIDFVDPAIGRSLIRVLGRHGVEVVFPKKQTCCGIPVFMSGDLENGLDLLKMNLEAFAPHQLDAIVVGLRHLRHGAEGELQGPGRRARARSGKTG